eukprot:scaffold28377_cov18-Tisochrysis_lutea.AAC.1
MHAHAGIRTGVLGPDRSFDLNSAQGPGPADNIFHPTNSSHNLRGAANNERGAAASSDNTATQAASAAAARAAAFLSSSREGIEELLRSPNSPGRPLDRCACMCVHYTSFASFAGLAQLARSYAKTAASFEMHVPAVDFGVCSPTSLASCWNREGKKGSIVMFKSQQPSTLCCCYSLEARGGTGDTKVLVSRLEGTDGADVLLASPNAHTTALQAALSDVERQNMQLRATLGMMRECGLNTCLADEWEKRQWADCY